MNIIFWILLWMLAAIVIWNEHVTVSTALKYWYKNTLNKKTKTDGKGHEIFSKKITGA